MKQQWIIFWSALFLVSLIYYFPGFFTIVPNGLSCVAYPFLCFQRSLVKIFSHSKPSSDLYRLINTLGHQNKKLLADNIALRGQLLVLSQAQELIAFKQQYQEKNAILSQVLLKTLTCQEHSLLIDRGAYHGIQKDMIAVWHNCLLGKIVEVFPLYSRVLLLTDVHCKIAAQGERGAAKGVIEGIQSLKVLSFSYVDHLSSIAVGESIFSSGEGLIFPKGFLLGTVKTFKPGDLYHTIAVQPACSIEDVDYCYVLLKGLPEASIF